MLNDFKLLIEEASPTFLDRSWLRRCYSRPRRLTEKLLSRQIIPMIIKGRKQALRFPTFILRITEVIILENSRLLPTFVDFVFDFLQFLLVSLGLLHNYVFVFVVGIGKQEARRYLLVFLYLFCFFSSLFLKLLDFFNLFLF